jgi:acetyltransferase-like isoleucine patch superfamily enzyme
MRTLEFIPASDLSTLWPLASTRPLASLGVAGRLLRDWQSGSWPIAGDLAIWQRENAWVAPIDAAALIAAGPGHVLVDADGTALAGSTPNADAAATATLQAGTSSFPLIHPWDLLRLNEELTGALAADDLRGEVSPAAHVAGHLVLGDGSRILPGVYIEGNVIIGNHCKIGPNCYLRGNTTIGDHCHIGQAVEIKNCLIGSHTSVGHLSYAGDSVLGDGVNFGAGTITSNFRHDGKSHRSMVGGVLIATGRRKFGAIIGDGVHTGIHTAIYPGRKLDPKASTRPGAIVQHDHPGGE